MSLDEGDTLGDAIPVNVVSKPQDGSPSETMEEEPTVKHVRTKPVFWRRAAD